MTHHSPLIWAQRYPTSVIEQVTNRVIAWFATAARPLPWRAATTSPWAVLVSEIMSHQTPMSRVEPVWRAWMDRWPTPRDLADAPIAEVLVAWGTLGYPKRALRLQECARVIADAGGQVPGTEAELLELPGVGPYTAAAVASFAFGEPTIVLDVNVRRVLSRVFAEVAHPKPALSKREHGWATQLVPQREHAELNAGLMELGALVCTARNPRCEDCPVSQWCTWLAAGKPAGEARTTQAWQGTDRQLRGAIMAVLKEARTTCAGAIPVDYFTAPAATFDTGELDRLPESVATRVVRVRDLGTHDRISRLIDDLVADGLATTTSGSISLP